MPYEYDDTDDQERAAQPVRETDLTIAVRWRGYTPLAGTHQLVALSLDFDTNHTSSEALLAYVDEETAFKLLLDDVVEITYDASGT